MFAFSKTSLGRHLSFLILLSIVLSLFTALSQHMNNFLIFRWSYFHLFDGTSLYELYPLEHNDLFKYSPTFALLMAPFAALPPVVGALLWNLCGASLFAAGLYKLPAPNTTKKTIFWVSLPEFIGSTQGFQSNIHMVGLLLLFFVALEDKSFLKAPFFLLMTFFIKIFGVLGFVLLLFSKFSFKDWKYFRKFVAGSVVAGALLLFLPALATSWDNFVFQHLAWLHLLKADGTQTYGFSLMGIVHILSQTHFNPLAWQIPGGLLWLFVLFKARRGTIETRLWGLVSLLYFLVVFNHKAESPTFIIPMVGFGIHLSLIKDKRLWWPTMLFTMGMVSLVYSDLFPREFKQTVADAYCFKIWPFLILYPWSLWALLKSARSLKNK